MKSVLMLCLIICLPIHNIYSQIKIKISGQCSIPINSFGENSNRRDDGHADTGLGFGFNLSKRIINNDFDLKLDFLYSTMPQKIKTRDPIIFNKHYTSEYINDPWQIVSITPGIEYSFCKLKNIKIFIHGSAGLYISSMGSSVHDLVPLDKTDQNEISGYYFLRYTDKQIISPSFGYNFGLGLQFTKKYFLKFVYNNAGKHMFNYKTKMEIFRYHDNVLEKSQKIFKYTFAHSITFISVQLWVLL